MLCNDRETVLNGMAEEAEKKQIKPTLRWIRWAVILLIVSAVAVGGTVYVVRQKPEILGLASPTTDAQGEVPSLVSKIGKLIELPQEQPTVATVTDVEKLRDQPFFANAQNGDKVLIFTNAKKAILYRPSANLIIDVAPVNIGQSATPSGQAAGAQTQPVTVVLRNGTGVVGLTTRYEEELKQKAPELVVVDRENAKKQSYTKTLLVDTKGTNATQASELAQTLGLSVGPLPAGEATSAADFLIILGSDKQ